MQRPRIVYLVTEDWYFMSHRLPMACAARNAGYDVHVITRVSKHAAAIRAEGFTLHPLNLDRGNQNPFHVGSAILQVRRIYKQLRPQIIHHVALLPTVVGSIASLGLPLWKINAVTGFGFVFTSRSWKARLFRPVMAWVLRRLLGRTKSVVLVQNPDDRDMIRALGVEPANIVLIPGSGVDTNAMQPMPEPAGPVTAAFVGRLLEDKGIRPLVDAIALLSARGAPVQLLIAGTTDPTNPASIPDRDVAAWRQRPGISMLGHVNDITGVWARAHIAVLPSRREGLPKSLLEAAACGRPIVATDVPGCREIARPSLNALLVPVDDTNALADAIGQLAADPALRSRFGNASRQLAVTEFSSDRIGKDIVALYDRVTTGATAT